MPDPAVPALAGAHSITVTCRYARATARYWVFERGANPDGSLPPTMVTVHLRQSTGGRRPDSLTVVLTPTVDTPNVQGGRWIDPDDDSDEEAP